MDDPNTLTGSGQHGQWLGKTPVSRYKYSDYILKRSVTMRRTAGSALIFSALTLCLSPAAWAGSFITSLRHEHPLQTLRDANNAVSLAAGAVLQNYQEALPSPSDIESGWMPGLRLGISGMNPPGPGFASRLYFALHYGYQQGNLRYQGFALATHQPLSLTDHSQVQTVSIRIGKGIPVSQRVLLTPYFLYRFVDWQRHLQNALGQSEHYESNSAGIGLLAQWTPARRWVLSGRLAWAEGFAGTVRGTHGILSPTVPLHPGATLQAGLAVDYRLQGPWHLFGGLRFTHYAFDGSPRFIGTITQDGQSYPGIFDEPASQTNRFGLDLGIAYQFA